MDVSLIFVTSSAFCCHSCDPAMPETSKILKEETEQLTAEQLIGLVRKNVAPYDQSADHYSNAPYISNIWESLSKKKKKKRRIDMNGKQDYNSKENAQPFVYINTINK